MELSKIQTYIEYKASLEGIPVVYINPKNTSKHRCGHVAQANREFRCECGLKYNRDLNSAINIALNKGMGWGSYKPELPDEVLARSQDGTGEAPSVSGCPAIQICVKKEVAQACNLKINGMNYYSQ